MHSRRDGVEEQSWLLEDLRARNAEILETQRSIASNFSFALLALAGVLSFVSAKGTDLLGAWSAPFFLSAALIFLGFALRFTRYMHFFGLCGYYIECDLLKRLKKYHKEPVSLYGWETFERNWHMDTWTAYLTTFGEIALLLLPALAFLAMGTITLLQEPSSSQLAVGAILLLINAIILCGEAGIVIEVVRLKRLRVKETKEAGQPRTP